MALTLGTVVGIPGETVRGTHPLIELATAPAPGSGLEELAVVIITAKDVAPSDPRVLITANIHGQEVCPCIVAHRIIEFCESKSAAGELKGTVVVYPSLNPTGHRAATRHPQFENPDSTDPNRMWPDFNPYKSTATDALLDDDPLQPWYQLEASNREPIDECWATLFEVWRPAGFQYHLDLHTMGNILNNPFAYYHHTFYDETDPSFTKADAEVLAAKMLEFHEAIGMSILMEPPPPTYIKANTHRTTVGAVMNGLHIPSTTLELGVHNIADPAARDAGVQSCKNVLSLAGVTTDAILPLDDILTANLNLGNLHRVLRKYPRAPCAGIVDYQVEAGTAFKKGDLLAVIRGMDGQRRAEVVAEIDGFIASWTNGVDKMKGQGLGVVGTPAGDTGAPVSWQQATGRPSEAASPKL